MEPLIIIYISAITILGLVAASKVCHNNKKINDKNDDTHKKEQIQKKTFKHYHSH